MRESVVAQPLIHDRDRISLCETLDRVLNKGAVVTGEVVVSVAGIDLLYVGLQVVLTSVETANEVRIAATPAPLQSQSKERSLP
jgi:hypothetical protein